jgi:hypothetical protein
LHLLRRVDVAVYPDRKPQSRTVEVHDVSRHDVLPAPAPAAEPPHAKVCRGLARPLYRSHVAHVQSESCPRSLLACNSGAPLSIAAAAYRPIRTARRIRCGKANPTRLESDSSPRNRGEESGGGPRGAAGDGNRTRRRRGLVRTHVCTLPCRATTRCSAIRLRGLGTVRGHVRRSEIRAAPSRVR